MIASAKARTRHEARGLIEVPGRELEGWHKCQSEDETRTGTRIDISARAKTRTRTRRIDRNSQ